MPVSPYLIEQKRAAEARKRKKRPKKRGASAYAGARGRGRAKTTARSRYSVDRPSSARTPTSPRNQPESSGGADILGAIALAHEILGLSGDAATPKDVEDFATDPANLALLIPGIGTAGRAASKFSTRAARALAAADEAAGAVSRVASKTRPGRAASRARASRKARKAERRVREAVEGPKKRPVLKATGGGAAAASQLNVDAVSNLAQTPFQLAAATVEDPGAVLGATVEAVPEMLVGVPQALYETTAGVVEAAQGDTQRLEDLADMILDDYSYRYGPLVEGDAEEFRRRVKDEGGLTPFALDALIVAPPAGRVAGSAARGGHLGQRLERFATEDRPALRSGQGIVKEQPLSRSLIGVARQRALDSRRRKKQDKRETQRRATLEPGRGEVVPLNLGRGDGLLGGYVGAIPRAVAQASGRSRIAHRSEMARRTNGVRAAIADLNPLQKRALKTATQLGIRDAAGARAVLPERIAQIELSRLGASLKAQRREQLKFKREIETNAEADGIDAVEAARIREIDEEIADVDGRIADIEQQLGRQVQDTPLGDREIAPPSMDEIPLMRELLEQADDVFTDDFARTVDDIQAIERDLSASDPGLDPAQAEAARLQQQARTLGVQKIEGETPEQFAGRIRAEAQNRGLAEGGYAPSELAGRKGYSEFALGSGKQATEIVRTRKNKIFDAGIESTDPEVLVRGLARNIKRKHQWNLVATIYDDYALAWSKGDGAGKTRAELEVEMADRNIDPNSVVLYDPRRIRNDRPYVDDLDAERTGAPDEYMEDRILGEALDRATDPAQFDETTPLYAIPREVAEELDASVNSNSTYGRLADMAIGKASRLLLGGNPPWLAFQIMSNAAISVLGGVGPVAVIRAQRWWNRLSDEERAATEPYIGAGHFESDVRETKLGSVAEKTGPAKNLVYGYQAFRNTAFGRRARPVSKTLDAFFAADHWQNNVFRKAVLYKKANREAYRRMNRNTAKALKGQTQITQMLRKAPDDQIRAVLKDHDALLDHGKAVSDLFGDYASFTAAERKFLKRHVMFYGYLRYSLRMAFYTLPAKHPVMYGLMGNLALLETDEIKELLGGEALPFAAGNIFLGEGETMVEVARANPAMNAITELVGEPNAPRKLAGMLPPMWGMAIGQISNQDDFTGRGFRVEGEPQPRTFTDVGVDNRLRILTNQGLDLFWPARTIKQLREQGRTMGDDSLVFDQRPIEYSSDESRGKEAQRQREFLEKGTLGFALEELLPMLPRSSEQYRSTVGAISSLREEERERTSSSGTSGGSSSFSYGGGSSSSSPTFSYGG